MKNTLVNKVILPLVVALVLVAITTSCKKEQKPQHEEQSTEEQSTFLQGSVIGTEKCTEEIFGYLIDVHTPSGIGNSLRYYDSTYSNVIKTYSVPPVELSVGDSVSGTYETLSSSSPSRVCSSMNQFFNVPELIINFSN